MTGTEEGQARPERPRKAENKSLQTQLDSAAGDAWATPNGAAAEMTQSEEQPPGMDGGRQDIQLTTLVRIKDSIIGHSLMKPAYTNQRFLRPVVELIRSASTLPETKIAGTAVLGSLFHGTIPLPTPHLPDLDRRSYTA